MKRYLFIYAESCDFDYQSEFSYSDRLYLEEVSLPRGCTDWEINEEARRRATDRRAAEFRSSGQYCSFSLRLVRIVEVARGIDLLTEIE